MENDELRDEVSQLNLRIFDLEDKLLQLQQENERLKSFSSQSTTPSEESTEEQTTDSVDQLFDFKNESVDDPFNTSDILIEDNFSEQIDRFSPISYPFKTTVFLFVILFSFGLIFHGMIPQSNGPLPIVVDVHIYLIPS